MSTKGGSCAAASAAGGANAALSTLSEVAMHSMMSPSRYACTSSASIQRASPRLSLAKFMKKVVASTLTNPSLGGGYVNTDSVVQSIRDLTAVYGRSFGGVAGWEYFASIPAAGSPWKWAQLIHDTINGAAAKLMGTQSSQSAKDAAYERIMARKAAREAAQAEMDVDLLSGYRLETTGN